MQTQARPQRRDWAGQFIVMLVVLQHYLHGTCFCPSSFSTAASFEGCGGFNDKKHFQLPHHEPGT
eukprot:1141337-Pelagomonas_calceolata.AAC.6